MGKKKSPPGGKTERIAIRVTPEKKKAVEAVARKAGMSMSKIFEGFLDIVTGEKEEAVVQAAETAKRLNEELKRGQELVEAEAKAYNKLREEFKRLRGMKMATSLAIEKIEESILDAKP